MTSMGIAGAGTYVIRLVNIEPTSDRARYSFLDLTVLFQVTVLKKLLDDAVCLWFYDS